MIRAVGQILRGRPTAKGIDFTPYNEYLLCQRWGCTPSQLRKELATDVQIHLALMNEEGKAQKANQPRR